MNKLLLCAVLMMGVAPGVAACKQTPADAKQLTAVDDRPAMDSISEQDQNLQDRMTPEDATSPSGCGNADKAVSDSTSLGFVPLATGSLENDKGTLVVANRRTKQIIVFSMEKSKEEACVITVINNVRFISPPE